MPAWKNGKRVREFKGKSLVTLPLDYVTVDTETTGLDSQYCNLIEVSAIRVRGGEITDTFSSLVRPPCLEIWSGGQWIEGYVDDFITGLTGITNEMLEDAPKPEEVLPQYAGFLGDDILLGHNAPFDVNFLYDAFLDCLGDPLRNDYLDTLRISRKLLPELPHHRLSDLAEALQVPYEGAHRALADCGMTHACYLRLREIALERGTEEDYTRSFLPKKKGKEAVRPRTKTFDESHPLFGKTVVITGALSRVSRQEAMQLIADAGGFNGEAVTSKTDFLVVGSTASQAAPADASGGLVLRGNGLSVLSEAAFLRLLNGG